MALTGEVGDTEFGHARTVRRPPTPIAARYSTGYKKLVVMEDRQVRLYWYAQ